MLDEESDGDYWFDIEQNDRSDSENLPNDELDDGVNETSGNIHRQQIIKLHHIEFFVSNALQSSFWYCINFGFRRFAIKEDENATSIAVRNGEVVLVFTASKTTDSEFMKRLEAHGDSIQDVAFMVWDLYIMCQRLINNGGLLKKSIENVRDRHGLVKTAVMPAPGCDVVHTMIEFCGYTGCFLPHYEEFKDTGTLLNLRNEIVFKGIDHFVLCYPPGLSGKVANHYFKCMGLYVVWSNEKCYSARDRSSMKIVLLANDQKTIQLVLVEPVPTEISLNNQIQEFLDYNRGPGVQHVAFKVDDIIGVVKAIRDRGVRFVQVPKPYYADLKKRFQESKIPEDFEQINQLDLLADYDKDGNYLLQTFTTPVQDRPTLFIELIKRVGYRGFGMRNVKALFSAVQKDRKKRRSPVNCDGTNGAT